MAAPCKQPPPSRPPARVTRRLINERRYCQPLIFPRSFPSPLYTLRSLLYYPQIIFPFFRLPLDIETPLRYTPSSDERKRSNHLQSKGTLHERHDSFPPRDGLAAFSPARLRRVSSRYAFSPIRGRVSGPRRAKGFDRSSLVFQPCQSSCLRAPDSRDV